MLGLSDQNLETRFSNLSITLSKAIPISEKKQQGIYFTPFNARQKIWEKLVYNKITPQLILEPSFGSGEFLNDILKIYPEATTYGVEKNSLLYKSYKNIASSKLKLYNQDFLEFQCPKPFDLIIGNPPFVVTTFKNPDCMTGRGNLFVLFVYKCITEHLKDNGILAMILPTSFYNCSYYHPCRKYIALNTTILYAETITTKYIDTAQNTMILILQKTPLYSKSYDYLVSFNSMYFINPNYLELRNLVQNTTTLKQLNCSVKTGTVIWNKHKEKLTDDPSHTLLIYSHNAVNGELTLVNHPIKKQYINISNKPVERGPCILIHRGYGNSFRFHYTPIVDNIQFYAENHLNVIKAPTSTIFQRILISFADPRTQRFIELFIGNGSLSKTEIHTILPIFM